MNSRKAVVFAGLCVAINIVLGLSAKYLNVPFVFLDALGTILGAVVYGPWIGGLIGILTNVIIGIVFSPKEIPFALVNFWIGMLVGLVAQRFRFTKTTAVVTGVVISFTAPLIGTPIAIYLFGGLAGGTLDIFFLTLKQSGQSIFSAAFFPRVGENLIDKILCCLFAVEIINRAGLQSCLRGSREKK
ncbi:MAG: CD3073 family putative ECF transporter S component [Negativicutes bacterium]|jgi:energy-coupling factor transport system substrate-specific component